MYYPFNLTYHYYHTFSPPLSLSLPFSARLIIISLVRDRWVEFAKAPTDFGSIPDASRIPPEWFDPSFIITIIIIL